MTINFVALRYSSNLEIELSPWAANPIKPSLQSRTISYIKPLNGSIGPKQTKCNIVDDQEYCDYQDYISLLTTTRTPDVPSGGVFSVKTRSCLTWASGGGTRVLVTTTVEWTGKSWVKGVSFSNCSDSEVCAHAMCD
jgi:hypothetical protein